MTEMERVARRDILMQHARALHDYCKKHPACGVDDCPFFYIDEEGFDELYPDGEKVKKVFIRDELYYIRINDEYKEKAIINEFYDKLRLGSELHRLDYLLMNIRGLQRVCEDNSELYAGLGKIFDVISQKRNIM